MTAISPEQTFPDRPVSQDLVRPSFFAGAIWAGLISLIALPIGFGSLEVQTAFAPADWYVHEGLYGYLAAIITGFLLGTISQQTGRPPLRGGLLIVLMLAWLAGRLAILGSATIGAIAAGSIDSLFLVLAAAIAVREVVAGRDRKDLAQLGVLLALAAGNLIFHLGLPGLGTRIGVTAVIMLVTLIGRRAITGSREIPAAATFDFVDIAAVSLSALALLAWIVVPGLMVTGVLMLVAGIAQAIRLAGWVRGRASQGTLTLIQQLTYGLIPLGFLTAGSAIVFAHGQPGPANIRAWLVGAVGTLTLAAMTRMDVSREGRPASVRVMAYVIYLAAGAGIVLRLFTGWSEVISAIAGAAWVVAFAVFVLGYLPLLVRPRTATP